MSKLLIVRKSADKAPKLTKAQLAKTLEEVAKKQRVSRDDLVTFLLDGSFNKLPVVKQAEIDRAQANRTQLEGWEIPASNLGRVGEATPSSRESVRLWIKQNLKEMGVNPDDLSVVLVD